MARSASIPQHLSDFEAEHLDSFTLLFDFAALQKQLYQNATVLGCCNGLTEQLSALILTAISSGLGITLQPKSTKFGAKNLQHG